jgi:hypothetical protein
MLAYGVWRGENLSGDTLDVVRYNDKSWNISLNGKGLSNQRTLNDARSFSKLSTKECIRVATPFRRLPMEERLTETRTDLWAKYWREDEPS